MLHEVSFASYNGRDQVQGWIYVPACKPKGIVQVIHGFGEHSRRYLHMKDMGRQQWSIMCGATGETKDRIQ